MPRYQKGRFVLIRKKAILYLYLGLVAVYLSLTFLLPPDAVTLHRYHISALSLRLLSLTIVVPIAAIWYMIFYGYDKLKSYSELIKRSKDGVQINTIAKGLLILALGQPISSIITGILRFVGRHHHDLIAPATILSNYIDLLFPLVGFIIIAKGTRGLNTLAKARSSYAATNGLFVGFALIGVGFCYFVMNKVISARLNGTADDVYYLPLAFVLLTLVVPYIYMWFLGITAAYQMFLYNNLVGGVLYRRSWSFVSIGLAAIIVCSIMLQYIHTASDQLTHLPLKILLLIVYLLLIMLGTSYGILALGAKRLQKIEEV